MWTVSWVNMVKVQMSFSVCIMTLILYECIKINVPTYKVLSSNSLNQTSLSAHIYLHNTSFMHNGSFLTNETTPTNPIQSGKTNAKISSANNYSLTQNIPHVKVQVANCAALFEKIETPLYEKLSINSIYRREKVLALPLNCPSFRASRGYIMQATSQEEVDFPLAFSILMYRHAEMVERLLRAIYRPNNVYCIHVDDKAGIDTKRAIAAVAECFPNVILPEHPLDVRWGTMSVVNAELACMRTLWAYKDWKYYINLTGEEFPLKTNRQIVQLLKSFNGTNDVTGEGNRRFDYRWETKRRSMPPPQNMTLAKGSAHVAVIRDFVDFVLNSNLSNNFQAWLRATEVPDETFFSSLSHNPQLGVPGATKALDEDTDNVIHYLRFKLWRKSSLQCHGMVKRDICIIGVNDLPTLRNSRGMFVNKFHYDFQPLAYDCLEELHYNQTRREMERLVAEEDTNK